MVKDIVLFGAGGLASEVLWAIEGINKVCKTYNILGCVVEEQYYSDGQYVLGYPVIGTTQWLYDNKEKVVCHCAIGIPKERSRIQKMLTSHGVQMETIISCNASVHVSSHVGIGAYITGGIVSTNCIIGDGVILNGDVIIGHDTTIGDYTCLMTRSDVGGRTCIGKEVMVGAHSYILPDRKIGDEAVIGAGSVVFSNVRSKTTVIGNPAKRMKMLEE